MSKPVTKHKKTFADVKAALQSNVAVTSSEILALKCAFIDSASILKGGDQQGRVLSDLDRLYGPVEHNIDVADATEIHYVNNCDHIFTRILTDVRVLILEGQRWTVTNGTTSTRWVIRSHIAPDGSQHMRPVKRLAPGETVDIHS